MCSCIYLLLEMFTFRCLLCFLQQAVAIATIPITGDSAGHGSLVQQLFYMPHPSHLAQGCPFPQQQATPLHPHSASLPGGSAAAAASGGQKKETSRGNEAEPVDERGTG